MSQQCTVAKVAPAGSFREEVSFSGSWPVLATIDSSRTFVRIRLGNASNGEHWSIAISYSGISFDVAETVGDVRVNNKPILAGEQMPKSCVITLGGGDNRAFATFDISNPEVVP